MVLIAVSLYHISAKQIIKQSQMNNPKEMKTKLVKNHLIFVSFILLLLFSGCIKSDKKNTIAVHDRSVIFLGKLENPEQFNYIYIDDTEYEELKKNLKESDYYALLSIPPNVINSNTVQLISFENITRDTKLQIGKSLEDILEEEKLSYISRSNDLPLTDNDKNSVQTKIKVIAIEKNTPSKINSREIAAYLVIIILALFIYLRIKKRKQQSKNT
jgi:ABC-2 type transport system permease protein